MNLIKIRNTCEGCPYLQTPAIDLHKVDQYYTCRLTFANTYDLEHFQEICPLKNIRQVLRDFVCFNATAKGNVELNFKKEKQIIEQFIEEEL